MYTDLKVLSTSATMEEEIMQGKDLHAEVFLSSLDYRPLVYLPVGQEVVALCDGVIYDIGSRVGRTKIKAGDRLLCKTHGNGYRVGVLLINGKQV